MAGGFLFDYVAFIACVRLWSTALDEDDITLKIISVLNRDYTGVFNHEGGVIEKQDMEYCVVNEWMKAASCVFGYSFDNLGLGGDPPDFRVSMDGEKVSVELTQLVNEEHKKRNINGKSPFHGRLFQDMQWTPERFLEELRSSLEKKNRKYCRSGRKFDVLVIHTAETWLEPERVKNWIEALEPTDFAAFGSAYLLFDYRPSWSQEHWPVFRLF